MKANWVLQAVSAGGTGNLTLGAADSGYIDLATGVGVGPQFEYLIKDGSNRERGIGHLSATSTLVRDSILETLVSGTYDNTAPTAINVTTAAKVMIGATAQGVLPAWPLPLGAAAGNRRVLGCPTMNAASMPTFTLAANVIHVTAFYWPGGTPVGHLYAEVTTGVASTNIRFGLADISNGLGSLITLADSGAQSSAAAGMVSAAVGPIDLDPGWYASMIVSDGAPTVRMVTLAGETPFGWHATTAYRKLTRVYGAYTFAAFPATLDVSAMNLNYSDSSNTSLALWAGE